MSTSVPLSSDTRQPLPYFGFFAAGENTRHLRHRDVLERWPVLDEAWARELEAARLSWVDRTPGAATFGR